MKSIRTRLAALGLALTMVIAMAGCSKENENIPFTLEEILSSYSDNTQLDDLFAQENAVISMPKENDENEDVKIKDCVTQLEEYISLANTLSALGIKPAETTTEEIKNQYSNLTSDEIALLIESLNDGSLTDIESARVKAGLAYVLTTQQGWIVEHGRDITEEVLKDVIKAAACEASGLEIEYFRDCTISSQNNDKSDIRTANDYIGTVTIKDPISGSALEYDIVYGKDSALYDAAGVLYKIQSIGDEATSYEDIVNLCTEGLNATKIAVAAGVKLEGTALSSETKASDAKTLILTAASATEPTE